MAPNMFQICTVGCVVEVVIISSLYVMKTQILNNVQILGQSNMAANVLILPGMTDMITHNSVLYLPIKCSHNSKPKHGAARQ